MDTRSNDRWVGALIVIVSLLGAMGAHGATIEVRPTEDLAPIINGAASGDTIYLHGQADAITTYALSEPVTVSGALTILGGTTADIYPHMIEIQGGDNAIAGGCPGNVIENPDFENGPGAPWLETSDVGAIIVRPEDVLSQGGPSGATHDGEYLGWFRGGAVEMESHIIEQTVLVPEIQQELATLEQVVPVPLPVMDDELASITQAMTVPTMLAETDRLEQDVTITMAPEISLVRQGDVVIPALQGQNVMLEATVTIPAPAPETAVLEQSAVMPAMPAQTLSVEQAVAIPPTFTHLEFYVWIAASSGNGTDHLTFSIDGVPLVTITEGQAPYASGYAAVVLDVSGYDTGSLHTLRFESTVTGMPTTSTFYVDDVCINIGGGPGCLGSVVLDGDFELGALSAWTISLLPIIDVVVSGGAHGGSYALKFGDVTPPNLEFYLWITASSGNNADSLRLLVDGIEAFSVLEGDPGYTGGYTLVSIPLVGPIAVADGAAHTLRFEANIAGLATTFFVDDLCVTLTPGAGCPGNTIQDPSFELGTPNPRWNETTVSGLPIIVEELPLTGSWAAKFGDHAPFRLEFYLRIVPRSGEEGAVDTFEVFVDGLPVFSTNGNDTAYQTAYTLVSRELLGTLADGLDHTLRFVSNVVGRSNSTLFELDDICLTTEPGPGCSGNVVPDPGFELGAAATPWTVTGADVDAIIIMGNQYSGSWAARFGEIKRPVLEFYLNILNSSGNGVDKLDVFVDDHDTGVIHTIPEGDPAYTSGYALVRIIIPAGYADGALHAIGFQSYITRVPTATAFWIDDVCLHGPGEACPGAILDESFETSALITTGPWGGTSWPNSLDRVVISFENPRTGSWAARLGGIDPDEIRLEFYLKIAKRSGNGGDYLRLLLDGEQWRISESDAGYDDYETVTLSLPAYLADGVTRTLVFESYTSRSPGETAFLVDDVYLGLPETTAPENLLENPDFESGADGAWIPSSVSGKEIIVDAASLGYDAHSGAWIARFGDVAPMQLCFYLWVGKSSGNGMDYFRLLVDANPTPLFSITEGTPGWAAYTAGYQLVSVDFADYADDGLHTLRFEGFTTRKPEESTFYLDDICLGDMVAPPDCTGNVVANPGFETIPDTDWLESSSNLKPIIVEDANANTGNGVARFGGIPPMQLTFQLWIAESSGNTDDYFKVFVNGATEIFSLTQGEAAWDEYTAGYKEVSLDFWDYTGLPLPLLRFEALSTRDPGPTTIYVDSVCLELERLSVACLQPVLLNWDFESGPGLPWVESSTNSRDIIVSDANAFEGSYAARFGGISSTTLEFYLRILQGSANGSDVLRVLVDGAELMSVLEDNSAYADWTLVSADFAAYADGLEHTLRFEGSTERLTNNTIFLVDDVCLGDAGNDLGCPGNLLANADFESGHTDWTELPADAVIREDASYARDNWMAQLGGAGVQIAVCTLEQSVTIPSNASGLRFYLEIPQATTSNLDTFTCSLDGTVLETVVGNDATYAGAYSLVTADVSAFADDADHLLVFESRIRNESDAPHFFLDDLCLASATYAPVITVDVGASLDLMGLALTGGSIGVLALNNATLNLDRCYIHDTASAGLFYTGAQGLIRDTVVTDCVGNGIHVNGGDVCVYQSSLLDNGATGVHAKAGAVSVVACLVYGHGVGLQGAGTSLMSSGSYIDPANVDQLAPGSTTVAVIAGQPDFSNPTGLKYQWKGKLGTAIFSGIDAADVTAGMCAQGAADFENQHRSAENMQVGADEVSGGAQLVAWTSCEVSPLVEVADGAVIRRILDNCRALGRFSVRIAVTGTSLAGATLVVKPERSTLTDAANGAFAYQFPAGYTAPVGEASFSLPGGGVVDGKATVYLRMIGQWHGLPDDLLPIEVAQVSADIMYQAAIDGSQFIIDTVVPEVLSLNAHGGSWAVPGDGLAYSSTDTYSALMYESSANFPAGWPGLGTQPTSAGTLNPLTPNPQIFFNVPVGQVLSVDVHVDFVDPNPAGVTVAGFRPPTDNIVAAVRDSLDSDPLTATGLARWVGGNELPRLDTSSYAPSYIQAPYPDGGQTCLGATWHIELTSVGGAHSWQISAPFSVTDLACNRTPVTAPLLLWWMTSPEAVLTSGPDQIEVADPIFTWDLDRDASETPKYAAPCEPLGRFQIWRADNQADSLAGPWTAITEPSRWIRDHTIDRSSVVTTSQTLGDLLRRHAGAWLLISAAGADESGNLQSYPAWDVGTQVASRAVFGAEGLDTRVWKNPGGQLALDTSVQLRLWHNSVHPDLRAGIRDVDVQSGEVDYGAATRVPLPTLGRCDLRVEAQFTIGFGFPGRLAAGATVSAGWEFYEDGRLAAKGEMQYRDGVPNTLVIPEDLLNPPPWMTVISGRDTGTLPTAFLNRPPTQCAQYPYINTAVADRLGDEGDPKDAQEKPLFRWRDVDYILTARTKVVAMDSTGTLVTTVDTTPASVQFTVYTGEPLKDEQPIKVFTRD